MLLDCGLYNNVLRKQIYHLKAFKAKGYLAWPGHVRSVQVWIARIVVARAREQVRGKRVTFYVCETRTSVSRSVKVISVVTMTCSTSTNAFHNNSQIWHASGKLVSNCFKRSSRDKKEWFSNKTWPNFLSPNIFIMFNKLLDSRIYVVNTILCIFLKSSFIDFSIVFLYFFIFHLLSHFLKYKFTYFTFSNFMFSLRISSLRIFSFLSHRTFELSVLLPRLWRTWIMTFNRLKWETRIEL